MNILKINGQALEGIYVDSAISFNKPAKRVSTYSVPGRNGDLVIDEGTFDNVLITYPVFEKNTFPTEFDDIVNELASLEGYQRIECSNDPTHYRLGRFVVPQNPIAKRLNRDGYWQLTFDCKPQRWLLSGEEDTEIDANPIDEYSGDIVSIDAVALDEITELKANIVPVQSGTGDPSPTNIRPISGRTEVNVVRTGKNLNPWQGVNYAASASRTIWLKEGTYVLSTDNGNNLNAGNAIYFAHYDANGNNITEGAISSTQLTLNGGKTFYYGSLRSSYVLTVLNEGLYSFGFNNNEPTNIGALQLEVGSTATTYEPYLGQTYPISLGQTVYGGTLNVTTGVLTIDRAMVDLGTLTWTKTSADYFSANKSGVKYVSGNVVPNLISSAYKTVTPNQVYNGTYDCSISTAPTYEAIWVRDNSFVDAAAFKTAMSGVQLVYELATPTTVQLTAAEVELLLGQNSIWADTGDVEVKVTSPTNFINPTHFNSKPLIRVYGIGDFRVNDITVTIASHDKPYIDIDCELQECYYGSENMNEYVSFSGNDFPELEPGNNYMLLASGITRLDVTPRWWIL